MPSRIRFPRHSRTVLVTAGLALGTLGGVAEGAAIVMDARSSAPVAHLAAFRSATAAALPTAAPAPPDASTSAGPLARPAAVTPAMVASSAPSRPATSRPQP